MNELQLELKNQLERFRNDKIEPTVEHDDRDENFKMEIFRELGELGFCGMTLPEEFGGAGLTYRDFCVALSEIAKSSVSYAATISVSTMVQAIINEFGNNDQKQKYLPELTSGKEIGAFCLSESSSGSDAASLKTTAKKVDGGYILNGSKMWITSGGIAKTYVVMARTGEEGHKGISSFLVQDGMEGFSYGKKNQKWDGGSRQLVNSFLKTALYQMKIFFREKALALKLPCQLSTKEESLLAQLPLVFQKGHWMNR